MRAAYLGPELGRREGARHAVQHRRGAAGARSRHGAQAVRPLERLPRDPVGRRRAARPATARSRTASRASPIRSGSSSTGDGERFLDEGADFRNYTYAKYGAEVLEQPGASPPALRRQDRARCCARSTTRRRASTRVDADTLGELADGARHRPGRASSARSRSSTRRSRPGDVRPGDQGRQAHRRASRRRSPTGRCRSTRRRSSPSRSRAGSPSRSAACASTRDARVLDRAGRPHPRPVRGRRAGRRPVLPQLPGRQRPDGRRRLRPPRGVDGRDHVIALRHHHAWRPA